MLDAEAALTWDKTNDRLGIGTSTPSYNLDDAASAVGKRSDDKVVGLVNSAMADFNSGFQQIESSTMRAALALGPGFPACRSVSRPAAVVAALLEAGGIDDSRAGLLRQLL